MAPVKTVFRFLIIRIHNKHPDLQPVIINIIIQPVHGRINDFIREGVTHKHGLNLLRGKNGSVLAGNITVIIMVSHTVNQRNPDSLQPFHDIIDLLLCLIHFRGRLCVYDVPKTNQAVNLNLLF